jgi:glycerol-3-phosphate acyltransferase PlsY
VWAFHCARQQCSFIVDTMRTRLEISVCVNGGCAANGSDHSQLLAGAPAMTFEPFLVVAYLVGYFFGSIPFGMVLTRLAGTQDLRSIGSGNIGATNVLRTGRKGLAAATLIGDMLKGTIAVVIMGYYGGPDAAMLAALGAFLGHLFPVWLKFNGGKGVATYIGVLIGLFWPAALMFCLIWLATAVTTRYSSLSALVAAFVTPLFLWWFGHPALASLFVVLTLLLFWKHSENIRRLQAGTEGRIGAK